MLRRCIRNYVYFEKSFFFPPNLFVADAKIIDFLDAYLWITGIFHAN